MNEISHRQLLCVATIDLADVCFEPEKMTGALFADAVLAGPDGWAGLLDAAKLQESDDRTCNGYILKAWATDPITGAGINFTEWIDLCQDQVGRIYESLHRERWRE